MMMTKHPSYLPLELMACGTTVVANFNDANSWLLKDGETCLLSPPSASCLASTLSYALDHHEELAPLRQKAADYVLHSLDSWDVSMGRVTRFMFNPPAEFQKFVPFGHRFIATRAHLA
jgi:glycosyltransferase involved in cell wall biosynthesis